MNEHRLDSTLLPDFSMMRGQATWNYSLQNYIESKGTFELAAAFASLFWPDFLEHKGAVLRADAFDEKNFDRWWHEKNGDIRAIERAMNLLHIEELVPSDDTELDQSVYVYLCQTLAEAWLAKAKMLFPNRHFVSECELPDGEEAASGPTVYLYEEP